MQFESQKPNLSKFSKKCKATVAKKHLKIESKPQQLKINSCN